MNRNDHAGGDQLLTSDRVREALRAVQDPELRRDIVSLGMVRDVQIEGGAVRITLALTTLECPLKDEMAADVRRAVQALDESADVRVDLVEMNDRERRRALGDAGSQQGAAAHLNRVDRVVAVMSGKGGVGKSLVAAMLAVELRRRGLRVGLMDADITGPSIPKMFGLHGHPSGSPVGIAPVKSASGVRVMSINLLLPHEDDAVIWRGPLISGAVKQFWGDVFWGTLDYLLVDLPPGTADVPLTVMQSLPLKGIVLVTTPQDLAGMVVRKAANMASQLGVPILGVVENMSYAVCPHCGEAYELFGPSHLQAVCAPMAIPVLARVPVDPEIARTCDEGRVEECRLEAFAELAGLVTSRLDDEAGGAEPSGAADAGATRDAASSV